MNQSNAAQPLLTDDEIRSILVEHGLDDEAIEDFARAIESALLSKLRAPVAGEVQTIGPRSKPNSTARLVRDFFLEALC